MWNKKLVINLEPKRNACVLVEWGNEEAVRLVRMMTETNWLGSKTFCYFRVCPKDGELPVTKVQSYTTCLDPDRRSRGKALRTEKCANELVNGMTDGILQMERRHIDCGNIAGRVAAQMERRYIYCENIAGRVAAQIGQMTKILI
jgi:hypothetical protein